MVQRFSGYFTLEKFTSDNSLSGAEAPGDNLKADKNEGQSDVQCWGPLLCKSEGLDSLSCSSCVKEQQCEESEVLSSVLCNQRDW